MQTLYINLIPLEKQYVELRYKLGERRYEDQRLDTSSIDSLIQSAKGSYYMLLPDLKGIGHQLFCWLDGTGRWLSRAINDCKDEGLVLALDVRERLRYLPWETLHDGKNFLVERLNPVVVPVRWINGAVQDTYNIQPRPLRILFMATSPDDVEPSLDFEQEEAEILAATRDIPLNLRVEESGCIAELSKILGRYREPFDIFHLTGHASIENEQPFFITETETGELHVTSVSEIADALRFRMPHLVFLSGCRTGEAPSDGAVLSLCESLIEQGCKAILGWGRPVSDATATQAAAHFYSNVAAGYQLTEALIKTYQYLRKANHSDWHLLRLYVRGECPKALVEPLGDQVWLPEEPVYEQFLDPHGIVRVATPSEFVGRRRVLQRSLKALRTPDKLGVVLHGLGGVGKSTIAARLLERLQGYEKIFIYQRLDEDKLLRQLADQCLSEVGQEILQGKLPLAQKLTKFLREGLNKPDQRLIFILDDFEANLELRADGSAVLKPEVFTGLISLLKAINQSRLPHRVIITSRYDFQLPELDQRLYREQVGALSNTDLRKKCNRLASFAPDSKVERSLQFRALETSAGNPRLLEWLDKVLQTQHLNQEHIVEEVEKVGEEFRESILAKELLERQPVKLQRMLGFCLVYRLPVPDSAIKALCPTSFDVENYISKSVAVGLLERVNHKEEILYYVPRILEPLLNFPEDSTELYKTAAEHLDRAWFFQSFVESIEVDKESSKRPFNPIGQFALASTERLFELYRLAVNAENPDLLTRANWLLVIALDQQKRYTEVATLCKFVMNEAFGHLGVQIISANLLYHLAKAQEHIGEVEEAFHNYGLALEICSHHCQTQELGFYAVLKATILHDLADLYVKQGNYQEALELYQKVVQIDKFTSNEYGQAKSFNQLAEIKRELGDLEEALNLFKEAYELASKARDENLTHYIAMNITALQFDLGHTDAWDKFLSGSEVQNLYSQPSQDHLVFLNNIAALKKKQGDLEGAKNIYEYLNSSLPSIENLWFKATILHNLATFYSDCGERELALELYNQALEIHKRNGDQRGEGLTLQEIGILHERQKNISDALKFLEESYQVSLKIGNKDTQTHSLIRIATILTDQDNFDEAGEKLNEALGLANFLKVPERQVHVLRELGRLQIRREDYHLGRDSLKQALEKCNLVADVVLKATILKLLGEVESFLGETNVSIEHLTASLTIYQGLNSIKDIEEVRKLIKDAHLYKPSQLYQAAITEAERGNSEAAIDLCGQALEAINQLDEQEIKANILLSMGNLLIDEGHFSEGFEKITHAVEVVGRSDFPEKENFENIALIGPYTTLKRISELVQDKFKAKELSAALVSANQCLILSELLADNDWIINALLLLGQIKINQGNYCDGIKDLERALSITKQYQLDGLEAIEDIIYNSNHFEAGRLFDLACEAVEQAKLSEATVYARQALEFQMNKDCQENQLVTLGLLGQLLLVQEQHEEGRKCLEQALALAQNLEMEENVKQLQIIIDRFGIAVQTDGIDD